MEESLTYFPYFACSVNKKFLSRNCKTRVGTEIINDYWVYGDLSLEKRRSKMVNWLVMPDKNLELILERFDQIDKRLGSIEKNQSEFVTKKEFNKRLDSVVTHQNLADGFDAILKQIFKRLDALELGTVKRSEFEALRRQVKDLQALIRH